ncbi:penicillin-binding transpeptidase domain-containing protein [Microlunatus speluncae]|uniref:penicillin-binding transpeptidase domain-containing protein n=1 Tax=Microlunatus speluncae TaxID=2594267 RepID=UPI00126615D5|nr:penicillin-binding transpeptidase domain-containing protein [Microlunatus speluncae]
MSDRSKTRFPALIIGLLVLALSGCTAAGGGSEPPPAGDDPARAAGELAVGLQSGDLTKVEFSRLESAAVDEQFDALVAGVRGAKRTVTVAGVETTGEEATAELSYTWAFPGVKDRWVYTATARLVAEDGRWRTTWSPDLVQPGLDGTNRLTGSRSYPTRGELIGDQGETIMTLRPVVRIGIDKAKAGKDAAKSADLLARLVKIDPKNYVKLVQDSGTQAFVEAIVLREEDPDRPSNATVLKITGARAISADRTLAPTRTFARALLGNVGEATKEIVDDSKGQVVAGDQVGLSGLQRRYDEQLRGLPGVEIRLIEATPPGEGSSTSSPGTSPTPKPSPSPSKPETTEPIFATKPVRGVDLTVTLNVGLQELAEKTLEDVKPDAAIAVIRRSDGALLAAATGPSSEGEPIANFGQYPPGSTFKVITALALLRAGLTPDSMVECPETITVDGRRFANYSDYPSSSNGRIPLAEAFAQSCNTAFIGQLSKIKDADLAAAAASLGFGVDHDSGFPSFYGTLGKPKSETERAATLIGQAQVLASPMSMAAVAASVSAGGTRLPYLIKDQVPEQKGKPLTKAEGSQLRQLMRGVVTSGPGRFLQDVDGPDVIAKTGTAEYGTRAPLKTRAWMIAAQGDIAVAVFVADGKSGSTVAGPLLEDFLDEVNE